MRSASRLVSHVTVLACFFFVLFTTQKLIHRRRSDKAELFGTPVRTVQPPVWSVGFRLSYHLSAAFLVGEEGRWEKVCPKEFESAAESRGCCGRCYTCRLTITHWIPSSSPPLQMATAEHAGSGSSAHQKASGRLRLQENDIRL